MQEFTLGSWRVQVLETGRFALDGGAMFGSAPRVLWQKLLPPDAVHRIPLALRVLLLRHHSGRPVLLVDTGIGDKYDDRFAKMFAIDNPSRGDPEGADLENEPPLCVALRAAGTDPDEITHVILTHLHFDHAGGVSRRVGGALRPTFPKAEHLLQKVNLETAESPNPRERASYLSDNVEPLRDVSLVLLKGEEEIFPGVRLQPSHGHTAGMQTVRVEGGGRVLYYVADLAPTRHHVHIPITMGYDLCPREIMIEKERLFGVAVGEEALTVFEHDPDVAVGTLEKRDGKYRLVEGLPAEP